MPGNHAPHLQFPVTIAIDKRSVDMKVQPLLPQRSQECREQSTREGAEEDGLDLNDGGIRTGPRRKWKVVFHPRCSVQKHSEDGEAHLIVVGAYLTLHVDDEGRRHNREETSLPVYQRNLQ